VVNGAHADPIDDHYEVLQLSPNADTETIHRVFRLMAQRYHPDNCDTGNTELFRSVKEAYEVLSNPQQRASYDAQLGDRRQIRFKIFQTWQSSRGVEAEKRKRHGILALLYGKRQTEPRQPSISLHELEDMLGCPKEHLEFSLWFLKENKRIIRSDNNHFTITCEGVVAVEAEELNAEPGYPQLLPGASTHGQKTASSHKETASP
jgi:curved DNA-binding protein CbpA